MLVSFKKKIFDDENKNKGWQIHTNKECLKMFLCSIKFVIFSFVIFRVIFILQWVLSCEIDGVNIQHATLEKLN